MLQKYRLYWRCSSIPSYHRLANIVIEQITRHKEKQQLLLAQHLKDADKELLDDLLSKLTDPEEQSENQAYNRYQLTLLKRFYQSTRLKKKP